MFLVLVFLYILFVCYSLFVRVRYMCVCAVCVIFLSFLFYCYGLMPDTNKVKMMMMMINCYVWAASNDGLMA